VRTREQLDQQNKKQKERRAANPEKYKAFARKSEQKRRLKRYGLSYDDYINLFNQQGNLCAICGTNTSGKRDWHVDHCHTTNIVRGILCHHCNVLLGHAKDNIEILASAINYLKGFKQ